MYLAIIPFLYIKVKKLMPLNGMFTKNSDREGESLIRLKAVYEKNSDKVWINLLA